MGVKKIMFKHKLNPSYKCVLKTFNLYTLDNDNNETKYEISGASSANGNFDQGALYSTLDDLPSVTSTYSSQRLFNGTFIIYHKENTMYGAPYVVFNEPIERVSKFECLFSKPSSTGYAFEGDIEFYDEYDNLLYTFSRLSADAGLGVLTSYPTPELATIKVYDTTSTGSITTSDLNQLTDVFGVNYVYLDYSEPELTYIRFAVSFDKRNTFKSYKDGAWQVITDDEIISKGMTPEEFLALQYEQYENAMEAGNSTFDIKVGMKTDNTKASPSIRSIDVNYLKIITD